MKKHVISPELSFFALFLQKQGSHCYRRTSQTSRTSLTRPTPKQLTPAVPPPSNYEKSAYPSHPPHRLFERSFPSRPSATNHARERRHTLAGTCPAHRQPHGAAPHGPPQPCRAASWQGSLRVLSPTFQRRKRPHALFLLQNLRGGSHRYRHRRGAIAPRQPRGRFLPHGPSRLRKLSANDRSPSADHELGHNARLELPQRGAPLDPLLALKARGGARKPVPIRLHVYLPAERHLAKSHQIGRAHV